MITQTEYLENLKRWKDEQVIKVVASIRRCRKSTLLMQYQQYLKSTGIPDNQIIAINFEELEYEDLQDYHITHSKETDYFRTSNYLISTTSWEKPI